MIAILIFTSALFLVFKVADCAGSPQTPVSSVSYPSVLPNNAYLLDQWAVLTGFASVLRAPSYPQGYHQRHLLQAFPAGLDEASILNSALQLQRTTCTSTSSCFSGADCVNGICSCRSPYVETKGQVSLPLQTDCHGAAGSSLLGSGCLSRALLLPCTVDCVNMLQAACLRARCSWLASVRAWHRSTPDAQGPRGCFVVACATRSARISAIPAVHSCAKGAVLAPLQRNSVRATAAALSASMVESVGQLRVELAGGQS